MSYDVLPYIFFNKQAVYKKLARVWISVVTIENQRKCCFEKNWCLLFTQRNFFSQINRMRNGIIFFVYTNLLHAIFQKKIKILSLYSQVKKQPYLDVQQSRGSQKFWRPCQCLFFKFFVYSENQKIEWWLENEEYLVNLKHFKQSFSGSKKLSKMFMHLTHFRLMFHFYTAWKRQKIKGFLTFSKGVEMKHWSKMGDPCNDWFPQNGQTHDKHLAAFAASFSLRVWPFWWH